MGDASPNHWTKNLRIRMLSARQFWAYVRLGLRTPERRVTKERGVEEGGKGERPENPGSGQ